MPFEHIQSPSSPPTNGNQTTGTQTTSARLGSLGSSVGAAARRGGLSTHATMQYIQHMQKTHGNQATLQMLQQQQERTRNRQTNQQDEEEADPTLEEETSPIIPDLGLKMYDEIINKKIKPAVQNAVWEKVVDAFMNAAQNWLTKLLPNFVSMVSSAIHVLQLFTKVTKFWRDMNPNVRAGVKFMVGVVVNKLENQLNGRVMLVSRYESLAADDAQTTQLAQTLITVLGTVETVAGYTEMVNVIRKRAIQYISGNPADEPQAEQQPADGEQAIAAQPEQPKLHSLDLKLIKLDMQDLTIAKTEGEGETRKKGGLDSKNKVTIRLFEKEYVVDEVHARLDWDFLLSIDASLMNKLITARTEFLIFEIENMILDKLNVGNDGLNELRVQIGKFKAGQLLEIDAFHGGYKRGVGFGFDIDKITLNLPDPLPKIQTGATLLLDAKGGFKSLDIAEFKAGSNFEVKYAQFTKQHLLIKEAAYALTYKNTTFKPMLNELLITKDRGIERISGGVSVEKIQPLDGLTIGGKALVGYEGDKKKFFLSINGTEISLDYGLIQGYGDIEELKLYQDGEFTGDIKDLSFSIGKFSFNARNVKIDPNGVLTAEEAQVVLGEQGKRKHSDEDLKEIGAKDGDKDSFGTSISMKAKGIKIEKGKLSVEKYEKSLNLNNVYKINLFGGGIHGVLDPKKEKASVTGKLSFPAKNPLWPLSLSFGVPIPPTPLMVFAKVEIGGGITATAAGEIARDQTKKEESIYDLSMKAQIEAELGFAIAGGIKLGSELLIALRAYLQAATSLKATAAGEVNGRIKFNPEKGQAEQDETNPLELKYKLQAELKAKIEAVLDFTAFMTYNKQIASKTLGEWILGSYNMEGVVGEKDGELTDTVKTPIQGGEDDTLGGAIPSRIKQPDNRIVRDLIQGSELGEEKYLYRNAHNIFSDQADLTPQVTDDVKTQLTNALDKKKPSSKNLAKVSAAVEKVVADLNQRRNLQNPSHLMREDEWIRYSANGDKRVNIVPVDKALKEYHSETDLAQKFTRLETLRKALKTYCDGGFDFTRGRKPMANKLLLDTNSEHELLLEKKKQTTL